MCSHLLTSWSLSLKGLRASKSTAGLTAREATREKDVTAMNGGLRVSGGVERFERSEFQQVLHGQKQFTFAQAFSREEKAENALPPEK